MPRAWSLIREQPQYRREAFAAGLRAAGYAVECQDYFRASIPYETVGSEDALVVWNRYGTVEQIAECFEAHGGRVLVAENGYLGTDSDGRQYYALAARGHNGSGSWPYGGSERWARLGIKLRQWRTDGRHVLVCPNRPFGPRGFAMPQGWAEGVATRLRTQTKREVRVRMHPGNWQSKPPEIPLARDLEGAWACVIWASSAGLHALIAGVPVISCAPHWVAYGAAGHDLAEIESPPMPERLPVFERVAWAQFTAAELASGEPFRRLLASR